MRTKYLIYPKFQLRMMMHFMLIILAIPSVLYFSLHAFYEGLTTMALETGLKPDHIFFEFVSRERGYLYKVMGLSTFVTIVFIFLLGIVLTHKVVGPIVRLTNHLQKDIENKKLSTLYFRENDYFHELAAQYNELARVVSDLNVTKQSIVKEAKVEG